MRKILFISNAANRSGAPFVLLYLLQWLKKNSSYQFDVLLLHDGPLKTDFSALANNVYLLSELLNEASLFNKIKRSLKLAPSETDKLKKVFLKIEVKRYDVIYGNTIVCLPLLRLVQQIVPAKIIIAIHELTTSIETIHTKEYVTLELGQLDCIIAGSGAVSDNLQKRYVIPPELIHVVHAFIHTYNLPNPDSNVLSSVGVPHGRFIIGGAGTPEWRKGVDLIVPLGMYLQKNHPAFNFHIVWIGGITTDSFIRHLLVDIEKAGLQDRVTLVDNNKQYLDYINSYDLFLMLSREDPFPLVSIEAAYLQKPILMFENTGGTQEIIKNGGGEMVPYLDIESMANSIVRLSQNSTLRQQMGKQLHSEVLNHYNSEVACKKVFTILQFLV